MERGESAGGAGGTSSAATTTTASADTSSAPKKVPSAGRASPGIGDYLFVRTVGQGQFGKVKLATHKKTGRKVAIKLINKLNLTPDTVKMVKREVQIMKMLWHPNIIRLYEVIETPSHLYLVMEYAPGGEVMDFILAKGRLSESVACKFFSQTAFALQYCHSQKTVHRDVKAENLLLDENMNIKLIDFGLSNVFNPSSTLKTFCGSPTYASPELVQRHEYTGPEVDCWSLGVLLYVFVCGELPFDGNTFMELYKKIINAQYTVPDFVSPLCRDLISKMLVPDPHKRANINQIIAHPWVVKGGYKQPVPIGVAPGTSAFLSSPRPINPAIVKEMVEHMGYDKKTITASILNGRYDDCAATYYLLYANMEDSQRKRKSQQMQPLQQQQPQQPQQQQQQLQLQQRLQQTQQQPQQQPMKAPQLTIIPRPPPPPQQPLSSSSSQSQAHQQKTTTTLAMKSEKMAMSASPTITVTTHHHQKQQKQQQKKDKDRSKDKIKTPSVIGNLDSSSSSSSSSQSPPLSASASGSGQSSRSSSSPPPSSSSSSSSSLSSSSSASRTTSSFTSSPPTSPSSSLVTSLTGSRTTSSATPLSPPSPSACLQTDSPVCMGPTVVREKSGKEKSDALTLRLTRKKPMDEIESGKVKYWTMKVTKEDKSAAHHHHSSSSSSKKKLSATLSSSSKESSKESSLKESTKKETSHHSRTGSNTAAEKHSHSHSSHIQHEGDHSSHHHHHHHHHQHSHSHGDKSISSRSSSSSNSRHKTVSVTKISNGGDSGGEMTGEETVKTLKKKKSSSHKQRGSNTKYQRLKMDDDDDDDNNNNNKGDGDGDNAVDVTAAATAATSGGSSDKDKEKKKKKAEKEKKLKEKKEKKNKKKKKIKDEGSDGDFSDDGITSAKMKINDGSSIHLPLTTTKEPEEILDAIKKVLSSRKPPIKYKHISEYFIECYAEDKNVRFEIEICKTAPKEKSKKGSSSSSSSSSSSILYGIRYHKICGYSWDFKSVYDSIFKDSSLKDIIQK